MTACEQEDTSSGTAQIAACALDGDGRRVALIRWSTWMRCGGGESVVDEAPRWLELAPPPMSARLLAPCIAATGTEAVPVVRASTDADGVLRWQALGAYRFDPPAAATGPFVLQRAVPPPQDELPRVADELPRAADDLPAVWAEQWGLDVVAGAAQPVYGGFHPDCTLYNVLSPALVAWCGASNRFGASALVVILKDQPTDTETFVRLRAAAHALRYPVLLVYGAPPALGCGRCCFTLQCILFHPIEAQTTRCHFAGTTQEGHAGWCLYLGEAGDVVC